MRTAVLIALCSVVVFASLGYTSAVSRSQLIVGQRENATCFRDHLIIDEEVKKSNSFGFGGNFKETKVYNVPGKGKITKITALDAKKKGASVEIKKGGVGHSSVTLYFHNEGHGFHYHVKIFATKE